MKGYKCRLNKIDNHNIFDEMTLLIDKAYKLIQFYHKNTTNG